ncbi:MAG TPA: hypothetical protein VF146_21940 [Bryobacteraceae bacterium]
MRKHLLTALVLLPAPVFAVDGVVLINQATITAARRFSLYNFAARQL